MKTISLANKIFDPFLIDDDLLPTRDGVISVSCSLVDNAPMIEFASELKKQLPDLMIGIRLSDETSLVQAANAAALHGLDCIYGSFAEFLRESPELASFREDHPEVLFFADVVLDGDNTKTLDLTRRVIQEGCIPVFDHEEIDPALLLPLSVATAGEVSITARANDLPEWTDGNEDLLGYMLVSYPNEARPKARPRQ